ncbi:hypothetical protein ACLB2K_030074 [Fragaria x ananassa]
MPPAPRYRVRNQGFYLVPTRSVFLTRNLVPRQIICVTEEEEEEDRSKPVEEEEYNCKDNMEHHSCREEQPGTKEFFEQAEIVPLQKIFPEDDEPMMTDVDLSKLDKLVAQAMQMAGKKNNEETSLKNKGQQAEGPKKYVEKTKQTVDLHSIERNIKLYKRGVEKRKEEECMYDTHEGLKPAKRTKKEQQKVEHGIVIHRVNCNTNAWKLLDEKEANHFSGIRSVMMTIRVYLQMLKEKAEKKKVSVRFLDIEAAVKHILVFIKRVYDSTIYPLSQDLDPEEWRENYGQQDSQGIEVDGYWMMSAEEKRTIR